MANNTEELLKLCELSLNYGMDFEIRFNPNKTNIIEFFKTNKDEPTDIILINNEPIKTVQTFKYLGVNIHQSLKNSAHLEKRRTAAYASLSRISAVGFNIDNLNPFILTQLYKAFIRPLIFNGIDILNLNLTELNEMKRLEGNIVKRMMGLSNRSRTTPLFSALKMSLSIDTMLKQKLNLFIRLLDNEFTRSIIIEQLNESIISGSLIEEITEALNIDQKETLTLIANSAHIRLRDLCRIEKSNNTSVEACLVREALKLRNRQFRTIRLNRLLKYNAA